MIIGVTGGIACGKSVICKALEKAGFIHIDADDVAHNILEDPVVIGAVTETFGSSILSASDDERSPLFIDRKKLGKIVFSDPEKMELLENITHPFIVKKIKGMINEDRSRNYVIEAIKLVSSGLLEICDELWIIHAEPDQQLKRLVENRGLSNEDASARLKSQEIHDWNLADADRIIYSTEPIDSMMEQVSAAINELQL